MRQLLVFTLAIVFGANAYSAQTQKPNAGDDSQWWKQAVIYEIYPRSFGDSNGDGIGDLKGIIDHLDYLQGLGVDAIWMTPFYPSPQVDFGYDISDYRAIDPQYGTMADFDRLVAEAKKRNIRIINDLVLNHTSDQHPWFLESKASRTNPKANWYVWADGKPGGQPPNNWISLFGHSAWQFDPQRNQYYYHEFYIQQPDLNWRDNDMKNAMWNVVRFWMDKGVSGFRLDAITSLFEDPLLRNEKVLPGKNDYGDPIVTREYTDNLPEVNTVLQQLRQVTDKYSGSVLIGETYVQSASDLRKLYGTPDHPELQLPMDTQFGFLNHLSASGFRQKLVAAETELGGHTPLFVFDNHDNDRSWKRYGDGQHDDQIARLVATLLLTPRATALLYYGQEIGLKEDTPKRKEDVKDPIGIKGWPKEKGRDGERTPMQWNGDTHAGFSTARKTWLPIQADYRTRNVATESREPDSLLNYYKTLIRLRKENPALRDGEFAIVNPNDNNVLSFLRKTNDGHAVLVAVNCSPESQTVSYNLQAQGINGAGLKTLISSFRKEGQAEKLSQFTLPAYGSYVGEIQ
ncbi:MAG TPA: alpha-glucosidase, partial [Bryobacteraceae bacterium]